MTELTPSPAVAGSTRVVCVPVTPDGQIDPRWGRAAHVVVAHLDHGRIVAWHKHHVGWDQLHDVGTEGGHHARVARFLMEHGVQTVVANHMGPPMVQMLASMRIEVRLGAGGDARLAVVTASATA